MCDTFTVTFAFHVYGCITTSRKEATLLCINSLQICKLCSDNLLQYRDYVCIHAHRQYLYLSHCRSKLYVVNCIFDNAPLTVVAVFVLAAVDGSIRLHPQVEALLAEQSRHDAFQLRLCNTRTHARTHTRRHTHARTQTIGQTTAPSPPRTCQSKVLVTAETQQILITFCVRVCVPLWLWSFYKHMFDKRIM